MVTRLTADVPAPFTAFGLQLAVVPAGKPLALSVTVPVNPFTAPTVAVKVSGVHHDSRRVEPGDLFVARAGAHASGAAFIADAAVRHRLRRPSVDPV